MCVIDSQYIRTHLELNSNHAPFHLPFLINCYANGFNSFIRVQRSAYVFVKIRHQNLYLVWVWAFKCKFWQLYNFSSHWISEYFFSLNNSALVLIIRCIESAITRRHPCQHCELCLIFVRFHLLTLVKRPASLKWFFLSKVIKATMPPFLDFLIIILIEHWRSFPRITYNVYDSQDYEI